MLSAYTNAVIRVRAMIVCVVVLVSALLATQISNLRIVIDPATALPQDHPYVAGTNLVEKVFGSNSMLVMALIPKDGDIFRPEVLEQAKRLSDGLLRIPGAKPSTLMSLSARRAKAITGLENGIDVQPLMERVPTSAREIEVLRRALAQNPLYRDSVVAQDGGALAISITMEKTEHGFRDGMERVYALAASARSPELQVAVSGFPMYLAQLEIYSQRMVLLFPLALLIVGLLHFEAFRTAQGFLLPLVTAMLSVVWGLGLMGVARVPIDAFNAVTPILILAVTAGHAVQLLKRYYEEYDRLLHAGMLPEQANIQAVVGSVAKVGPVMLAAAMVAAAGFFSLATSPVATIRTFGVFTGLGILSGLIIEFSFIPALRSWLPPPQPRETRESRRTPWDRMAEMVAALTTGRRRGLVYGLTLAVAVCVALGISRISLDNSTRSYFTADLPFQQEDQAINDHLAGTNTLYVVFEGDRDDAIKDPAVLDRIDRTQAFLNGQEGVGKTMSVADLVRRLNRAMHGDDPAHDAIPDDRELIAQYLLLYSLMGEPSDFDSYVDSGYRRAVVVAYLKNDSSTYVNGLIERLNGFLAGHDDARVTVHIGGSVPETAALAQVLVESKFHNIAQMGGVVFLVSALIFRSLTAGALVLAPLMITVVVNYGTMGLTGMPLNTPNSISAALAIGIGADYAIYLLYRIREELAHGHPLDEAIRRALRSAGKAILYVGSAIAGGYSVLMLSLGFNIHIWFGSLIVLSMAVSAVSALLLVPSLLMTFRPRFIRLPTASAQPAAAMLAGALCLGLFAPPQARAADEAVEIMTRNYAVSRFDDSVGDSTMTLVDKDGGQRVRQLLTVTKLQSNAIDNRRMVRFMAPADIRNTVILMIEHSGGDDEMMIYLPALKKTRRLASYNKKDAFVGSDLSYGDVIGHRVADWTHRVLGREVLNGMDSIVVESLPGDEAVARNSGYSRRLNWVAAANALAVRSEFYDLDGVLLKVGQQSQPLLADAAGKRWQPMRTEVTNVQTGHKTVLEFSRFAANQGVEGEYFTARYMERQE